MPPGRDAVRARCLLHAGNANWTATGLVDGRPECGRAWLRTGCARRLFSGRDALFIGNSVIRRQMYTVLDLLAGPAARRLQGSTEFVPKLGHRDSFPLSDPLLMSQHGVLNPKTTQSALPGGASRWSREALVRTRMWDRDGDPDAYHAAQLVTIDLDTGEHRFARPHALCGIGDAHMKFGSNRNMQWRAPGLGPGAGRGSILSQGWRSTKYAGREWRPVVSFRNGPLSDRYAPLSGAPWYPFVSTGHRRPCPTHRAPMVAAAVFRVPSLALAACLERWQRTQMMAVRPLQPSGRRC